MCAPMTTRSRITCTVLCAGLLLTAAPVAAMPYTFTDINVADPVDVQMDGSSTTAIFVDPRTGAAGSEPLPDSVIRLGDMLFGSTVTDLTLLTEHLDDYGQLTFHYRLADGRSGIAHAAPHSLAPATAPSSLGLLGMGLIALGGLVLLRWLRDLLKRWEESSH